MVKLEKVTCGRCGGSGRFSFNPKDGDRCYGCNGRGFVMVDPVKHAKAKAAKAKREEAAKGEIAAKVKAGQKRFDAWHEKYQNDPRLGSAILARMAEYEAVRFDVYKTLDQADNGGVHPSTLERLAQNAEILLDVPFKEKETARKLGARWNPLARAWYWPESVEPLPSELEKYRA